MSSLWHHLRAVLLGVPDGLIQRLPDLLAAIALVAVFWVTAWLVRRALWAALRRSALDVNVSRMLTRVVYSLIVLVGVLNALSQLRVNLAALGIGLGLLSFGIGFALKDILSNFLAGLLILWTRPFVNGDQIRVRDFEGTVEAIEMRGTILRTYDGRRVIIPNADVYTNPVTNNTFYLLRRSSVSVSVAYDTDLPRAEQVMRQALRAVPEVSDEPAPDILVRALGSYALELEVRIWTPTRQLEVLQANSAATKAIRDALAENHIEMPLPTIVSVTKGGPPTGPSV
jgi:small conductance mechanosensitive channel